MATHFFEKPFDEATLVKLELFKNYLKESIPVFIKNAINLQHVKGVNVFDFFAGAGKDAEGRNGSPLLAIEAIPHHFPDIVKHKLKVSIYLNEYSLKLYQNLENEVNNLHLDNKLIRTTLTNQDFNILFNKWHEEMKNHANLVWLDQFGVKFVNKDIFQKLTNIPMSDLLFFISSSIFKRFAEDENIKSILNISKEEVQGLPQHKIHRFVAEKYKAMIPQNKEYYLTSFSIKKKTNIYGLIFGSSHPLGLEKFLKVCWDINPNVGDANFDIDEDKIEKYQHSFFPVKAKKLTLFEDDLEKEILNSDLKTEWDVYLFTLINGFIGSKHTKPIVEKLIREKKLQKDEFGYSYSSLRERKKQGTLKKIIKLI